MALQKDKTHVSGVVCNYHRIEEIVHSATAGTTKLLLALYVDSAARQAGNRPLSQTTHIFDNVTHGLEVSDLDSGNLYTLSYTALKTLAEFDGALDV